MATLTFTTGQLLTRVYRILGILPSGGNPTNDQLQQGIDALNLMITGFSTDGINLWRLTQVSMTILGGEAVPGNPFVLTPQILQLAEARWVVSPAPNLYERPMRIFTYADYMILPNKLSGTTSGPSVIMFDKQDTASNIYLWPPPTLGGTVNATVARQSNTVAEIGDTIDVPSEWLETVLYCAADRLMDDEGVAAADQATAERVSKRAALLYEKAINFDRPASVFIRPYNSSGWGRRTYR